MIDLGNPDSHPLAQHFARTISLLDKLPWSDHRATVSVALEGLRDAVEGALNERPASFGWALEQLKAGKAVRREAWGDYVLYLVPGSMFTVNREPLKSLLPAGTPVEYQGHLDIMTRRRDGFAVCQPYALADVDVLATDWVLA